MVFLVPLPNKYINIFDNTHQQLQVGYNSFIKKIKKINIEANYMSLSHYILFADCFKAK